MPFSKTIGQETLKKHLIQTFSEGRIPHAQLFVAKEGSGALAMAVAYANLILCGVPIDENDIKNQSCQLKVNNFSHPDLHFVYPTVTTDEIKKNPKSVDFITDWRLFLNQNIYGSLLDWYQILGVQNKQGEIRVEDAGEILRLLSLKSFEGGYKVMIVWMAEKINISASNKLLKLLEEPTEKTVLILITENEEDILPTIRSRCQTLRLASITDEEISNELIKKNGVSLEKAHQITKQAQGNFNNGLKLLAENETDFEFEHWFVNWVRAAFRAKGNAAAIIDLLSWSEQIAGLGREIQKKFLTYCIEMFRQALLTNYNSEKLVYIAPKIDNFSFEKLAPFVNGNNINEIFSALSDAIYHIERNGNAKIILTDLSIKLTRLIHKK
jgi:DNA polymerase III subunit delta'